MSKNIFDISMPHGNLDGNMRYTKVGLTPRVLHANSNFFHKFCSACTTNFSEKKGMLVVYLDT